MAIERRLFPLGGTVTNSPQYFQHYSITFVYRKNRFEVWDQFDFSYDDEILEMLPGPLVEMSPGLTNELFVSKISPVNVWANFGIKKVKFVSDDPDVELTLQIPGTTNQINLSTGQEEIHPDLPKALAAGGEHLGFRKKNPDGTWFNMTTPKHFMTGSPNNAAVEAELGVISNLMIDFDRLYPLSKTEPGWSQNESTSPPSGQFEYVAVNSSIIYELKDCENGKHLAIKMFSQSENKEITLNDYYYRYDWTNVENSRWYAEPGKYRLFDLHSNFVYNGNVMVMARAFMYDGAEYQPGGVPSAYYAMSMYLPDQTGAFIATMLPNDAQVKLTSLNNLGIYFGKDGQNTNPLLHSIPLPENTIATFSIDGLVNVNDATPISKEELSITKLFVKQSQAEDGSVKVEFMNSDFGVNRKWDIHRVISYFEENVLATFIHKDYNWYVDPTTYKSYNITSTYVDDQMIVVLYKGVLPNGEDDSVTEASFTFANETVSFPNYESILRDVDAINNGMFWFNGEKHNGTEPLNTPLTKSNTTANTANTA